MPVYRHSDESLYEPELHEHDVDAPSGDKRFRLKTHALVDIVNSSEAPDNGMDHMHMAGGPLSGVYYTEMNVGTPPISLTLTIDTGSADTVFTVDHCFRCENLGGPRDQCLGVCKHDSDTRYDSVKSSTAVLVPDGECSNAACAGYCFGLQERECCVKVQESPRSECRIDVAYGDGSSGIGAVQKDIMSIPKTKLETLMTFGKLYRTNVGNFPPRNTDGVMGFSPSKASNINEPTFMDRCVQDGLVKDMFSVHLDMYHGSLYLGTQNHELYTGNILYTPLDMSSGMYHVTLMSLTVGDRVISIDDCYSPFIPCTPGAKAIVDSGTTMMIFPTDVFNVVRDEIRDGRCHIKGLCGSTSIFHNYCYQLDERVLATLPTVKIALDGVNVVMRPEHYLVKVEITRENEQFTCYSSGISGWQSKSILLGDPFMRLFYTVFDRSNSRLGLANAKHYDYSFTPSVLTEGPSYQGSQGFWLLFVFYGGIFVLSTTFTILALLLASTCLRRASKQFAKDHEETFAHRPVFDRAQSYGAMETRYGNMQPMMEIAQSTGAQSADAHASAKSPSAPDATPTVEPLNP